MRVVVAPHIDDEALSLGGHLLWWKAEQASTLVLYVFSMASWTNPDGIGAAHDLSLRRAIGLRKAEAEAARELAGHRLEFLDFWDCAERGGRRDRMRKLLTTGRVVRHGDDLVGAVTKAIEQRLRGAEEVYFPLACGDMVHPDHELLRDVGSALRNSGPAVFFYEDLPYAARRGPVDAVPPELLDTLRPVDVEIDLDRKLELVRGYATQVSDAWIDEVVAYALDLGGGRPVERVWAAHADEGATAASPPRFGRGT